MNDPVPATVTSPDPPEASEAPRPGCAPLSDLERQALLLAVRCTLLELRGAVVQRIQRGEPLASIEGDLGPLVTEKIKPVNSVLFQLAPDRALAAGLSVAWAMAHEALRGDLASVRQLIGVAQRPAPPATGAESP